VKFSIAPDAVADDPGNVFDTEETIKDLIEHNAVLRRLCGGR